jgi:hypothetical protein
VNESQQSSQPVQSRANPANQADNDHNDDRSDNGNHNSNGEDDNQGIIDDQIVRNIEAWKSQAKKRRLTLLQKGPLIEVNSWLQFTQWNEVLSRSKHNIVKTHRFAREADPDEPELVRIAKAWNRILKQCLDTLAASDHKNTLK